MLKSSKIIAAAAIAVLAAAGGTAFTASGVDNQAGADQFIGGTVSQTVHGVTLSGIVYDFVGGSEGPKTAVTTATLTFANAAADGQTVTVSPAGGTQTTGSAFVCTNVDSLTSVCTWNKLNTAEPPVLVEDSAGYIGLNSLSVTVGSTNPTP
jgi:hypothetical protein